ncbi:MAG: S8 family serine peptidase [Actinomycetota bacterium]|nr:S8 family serine peptidase [Actinomycetota bacterium]
MNTRRGFYKGALTIIFGAVLFTAMLILQGTMVLADAPWPEPPPGQDPYAYEEYCFSEEVPDDFDTSSEDYWKVTGDKSSSLYHTLLSFFNRELYEKELEGVMGASVDRAWSITTGRPDVLIAELDSGVNWSDADLALKCQLNRGELPPPQGAETWDKNQDGVFNVEDYQGDPRLNEAELNNNGILDPEDLIWRFSNGKDEDGNGYIDDICGWDFLEDDNDAWDEVEYGHGTSECKWTAGEANNGEGFPGVCPSAMLLPVRVGDSFIVDVNDFAQGVIFGMDSGAWIIQEALGSVNQSPLAQAAINYAYDNGVTVIASAADEESAHQNWPCTYERTVQVNSVTKYEEMLPLVASQFPPSYLYLGGITNYGAHSVVSTPSGGHSSGATGRLSGIAALLYSVAENKVQRGELWDYPGLETPLSACEVKQLIAMTADDIDFSPDQYGVSMGLLDSIIGTSERFSSTPGWDPYFGYGRANAYEAVKAVEEGRIPPEAEISSPLWFELINPGQVSLEVRGRVAAERADNFSYTVEFAPGWDPGSDDWITVREDMFQYEPVNGVLATLDLGEVNRLIQETMTARGGDQDPNRYAFTIRVRVVDSEGNWGEDRKMAFCFDDGSAYTGTPLRLGSGMASSPRFADLGDDGIDELIVANESGYIHAFNGDFSEVEGWPVHVTALPLHYGSEGFTSGQLPFEFYASVVGTPAVGDLDHDGTLEVVAGDTEGRVYAWDSGGNLLPGFPVRSNPQYSIPDRADWWTDGALPAEWYAARFVPDRVHQLDTWNCLEKAFLRAPLLCNLDNSLNGSLEIVTACLDQHLYAWHADGAAVSGWPVKLVDPEKVASFDPLTHTCTFNDPDSVLRGSKIVTNPSIGDLDGDGDLEVVCGTNEAYAEPMNVSGDSFGLSSLLGILSPLLGEDLNPGNTRAYAVHHDGTVHGLAQGQEPPADQVPANAYLEGWPVKIAMMAAGMLPSVAEGVNGPPAIADLDGDGSKEIGISSAAGPGYLLELDGTSHLGVGEDGLPLSLECDGGGSYSDSGDSPVICALGGGCMAALEGDGLSYISPTMGLGRAIDLFLPASQIRSDDQVSAWSASGAFLDHFPSKMNCMMFFLTPGAADIDGDGAQEVLAGSSYYDLRAVDAAGDKPDGWPKFTGGWSVSTPALSDFDGDGDREMAVTTREGWLLLWETSSSTIDKADWPEYGHDSWNTGCLDTDAERPAKVRDLAVELVEGGDNPTGVKLTWTAPGDDGDLGQALLYDVRYLDRAIDAENWDSAQPLEGAPLPGAAGSNQEFMIEGFPFEDHEEGATYHFALQARDEAGNLSPISNVVSASYEGEPGEPEEPEEPDQEAQQEVHTWYLAEGSTGSDENGNFETWILVQNPGTETANIELTYMTAEGTVPGPSLELEPETRRTVRVADEVENNWSVSTKVESDRPLIVERAMYWSFTAEGQDVHNQAAHASIGVTETATTWYLAEGSTGGDENGNFETWILVQNPGGETAGVNLTYMTPDGSVDGPRLELPPGTRRTVNVAETLDQAWSVSTMVESDQPVIAERAVYWNSPDVCRQAAHASIGVTETATTWYLAEGSTGGDESGNFETYILVQNPSQDKATARLTCMTGEGTVPGPTLELEPETRQTIRVADEVDDNWSVSTMVESDQPVIAERAVYWNSPDVCRQAAHASIGVTETATTWYLAEGSTGGDESGNFETWILVQNPGGEAALVSLTYMTPDGPVNGPDLVLEPGTRRTVSVAEKLENVESVSTMVESDRPVIVERAVYWSILDVCRQAAHASIGAGAVD